MQTSNEHSEKPRRIFLLLGYLFSVSLPLLATLSCFPLWRARGADAVLAGGTLLLIAFSALPLWRALKSYLKSPSVWTLWLFGLILFSLISRIIEEMCMICLFGWIGNLIGALCFRLARRRGNARDA